MFNNRACFLHVGGRAGWLASKCILVVVGIPTNFKLANFEHTPFCINLSGGSGVLLIKVPDSVNS